MAETYTAGYVTAYGAAVRGGYTGTYEEFCAEQAGFAENAAAVAQAKEDVETMQGQVEQAAATFTGTTVPAAVTDVQEAGATQVQAVQSEGTMQAAAVETVGAQQTAAVGAAGSDAVDAVEAAETAATGAVTAAQTAAVQAVQTESATQQAAVQAKGEQTIASIPADYTALTEEVNDVKSALDEYVLNGNNNLPLKNYQNTLNGITVIIEDGVIKVSGTATRYIRMKLSGDYSMISSPVPASWKAETMPQFETNKKYSLHNQVISGNLPQTTGVSLRDSAGSSVVSISIPEATLSAVPAFAMLYIPSGETLDVSFIPMFINGGLDDEAYQKKLNPFIKVDGIENYLSPDLSASFIYNSDYQSAIKLPASYKPVGKQTPMIILGHGLSSTISASTWGGTDMITLVGKFVSEGFAVIDVNQVTTQDWCNPALIKRYVSAIQNAMENYNVVPVAVFGESMGSLIGLCLATLYPVKVCVISGIRLDLAARYAEMSSADKAIVNENLGFVDGYDSDIAAGWDKTAISTVTQDGKKVCPCDFPPTFFIVGSDDTLTKEESLVKIAEIKRGGTICKTTEYTGNHNDVCYLKTGTSFEDAVEWIRQWL